MFYLLFLMKQISNISSIIHCNSTCASKYPNFLLSMNFTVWFFPSTRLFNTTRLFGTKEYCRSLSISNALKVKYMLLLFKAYANDLYSNRCLLLIFSDFLRKRECNLLTICTCTRVIHFFSFNHTSNTMFKRQSKQFLSISFCILLQIRSSPIIFSYYTYSMIY